MRSEEVTSRAWWLVAACAAFAIIELQWANPLSWDEFEFFRATRWLSEGRVPYRDYWEHHTPLQWLVFAPFAKVFGGGPGVQAVLAMRWTQLLVWLAAFYLLGRIARRVVTGPMWPVALAFGLLVSTPAFMRSGVQYRVDALGNLLFVGALTLLLARGWTGFGALMSLGVLANMRLAPLAVLIAAGAVIDRREWLRRTWRIAAGVAGIAAGFLLLVLATGTWPAFVECILIYNRDANRLSGAEVTSSMLLPIVFAPFQEGDVSGIALWALGLGGLYFAIRDFRLRGPLQVLALVWAAAMIVVTLPGVQYDYHLQSVWLLMVPLAAVALERFAPRVAHVPLITGAIVVVSLVLAGVRWVATPPGGALAYQNRIMIEVERFVPTDGRVWDGAGYALRRESAYRYWFLPSGVRFMAKAGMIEPYDIARRPPDAIVHNYRTQNWMVAFQDVGRFAVSHYVPLYRNLWIPGYSILIPESGLLYSWTVVKDGSYDIRASTLLAKHPWFSRPLRYTLIEGPAAQEMEIPLERLPRDVEHRLHWRVDGVLVPAGARTLTLRKGAFLEMLAEPGPRAAVMVVPSGTRTLSMAPAERFVF